MVWQTTQSPMDIALAKIQFVPKGTISLLNTFKYRWSWF